MDYQVRINNRLLGPLPLEEVQRRAENWQRTNFQVEIAPVGSQAFVPLAHFLAPPTSPRLDPAKFDTNPIPMPAVPSAPGPHHPGYIPTIPMAPPQFGSLSPSPQLFYPSGSLLSAPPVFAAVKPASFLLFLILSLIMPLVSLTLAGVIAAAAQGDEVIASLALVFTIVAGGAWMWAFILWLIYLHRAWAAIQLHHARTTPGQAVGLLFVPLFNIYWMFPAIYGWAEDYNKVVAARQIPTAPQVSEGIFLTTCIFALLLCVPYLNLLILLPFFVLCLVVQHQLCRAVNFMAQAHT